MTRKMSWPRTLVAQLTLAVESGALFVLVAFLTLLPLITPAIGSAHNSGRLLETLLLLLSALCLVAKVCTTSLRLGQWWKYGAACLILTLLSSVNAARPAIALREVALIVGLIALAVFVAHAVQRYGFLVFSRVVVTASAMYALLVIVVATMVFANETAPNGWLLIVGYDNPRFLNHVQSVVIPLLVGGAASLTGRWRVFSWFALVMSFVLLALSFGRATMLALASVTVLAAVLFPSMGWRYSSRMLIAAVIGGALYWSAFVAIPSLLGVSVLGEIRESMGATGDHSRFFLWRLALSYVSENPWLGIGPMHFAHRPNPTGAHPHNIYLQIAAEYGIPVLLLVVCAATVALVTAARRIRHGRIRCERPVAIGAFCACLSAAVDGFFSGNFVMPASQVWIAVATGLLWGCLRSAQQADGAYGVDSLAKRFAIRTLAIVLLISQLWMFTMSLQEARSDVPRLAEPVKMDAALGLWWPRYWLDGWF